MSRRREHQINAQRAIGSKSSIPTKCSDHPIHLTSRYEPIQASILGCVPYMDELVEILLPIKEVYKDLVRDLKPLLQLQHAVLGKSPTFRIACKRTFVCGGVQQQREEGSPLLKLVTIVEAGHHC